MSEVQQLLFSKYEPSQILYQIVYCIPIIGGYVTFSPEGSSSKKTHRFTLFGLISDNMTKINTKVFNKKQNKGVWTEKYVCFLSNF